MTMLARKIARTVYHMLKQKEAFDAVKFFASERGADGGAAGRTQVTPWGEASFVATNTRDARRRRSLYAKTPNLLGRIGPPSAPALT